MIVNRIDHPPASTLARYLSGRLDDSHSQEIEQHVQSCSACIDLLDRVSASGSDHDWLLKTLQQEASAGRIAIVTDQSGLDAGGSEVPLKSQRDVVGASGRKLPERILGYEILSELGRGGMGVVYRAHDPRLKRDVALKLIVSGGHGTVYDKGRVLQEAETIARLQHPGIVQIYEVGEHDGHPFLALEFVEGVTLDDLLKQQPQDFRWAAAMMSQIARAVHFAHQQSIVHRDLKPANVLVRQRDSSGSEDLQEDVWNPPISMKVGEKPMRVPIIKITDFGLAKHLGNDHRLTQFGQAVGTPAYMSPEQVLGNSSQVGTSSDIYALGIMLYEMVVGHPPYKSTELISLVTQIVDGVPESPRAFRKEIPRDLESICFKGIHKIPSERYATALDFAIDLELFLQHEPINARPLSVIERMVRWARYRPLLAATYLGSLFLYVTHLIAKWGLGIPFHQVEFDQIVTPVLLGWVVSSAILQRWMNRAADYSIGLYIHTAMILGVLSYAVTFDAGPRSAPIPFLLIAIPIGLLLRPKPSMVWFVSGCVAACYTFLVLHALAFRPQNAVSVETVVAFLIAILFMGMISHLLVKRVTHYHS